MHLQSILPHPSNLSSIGANRRMIGKTRHMSLIAEGLESHARAPGWPDPAGGRWWRRSVTWFRPRGKKIPKNCVTDVTCWVHMARQLWYSVPMGTAWVECWKCDECGFRWIKTEVFPERCPSRKCRSRKWNVSDQPTVMRHYVRSQPVQAEPQPIKDDPIPPKTSMNALRAICAGKFPPDSVEPTVSAEIPICRFQWWEDGTAYECLMDKGHKSMKHGQRGMVRRVDE